MGGCVASYIAKKSQVDFVFSDRTFASLIDVTRWGFGGKIISIFFRYITFWNEECDEIFYSINKNTYRVVGGDANDTLIVDMSSLKTGISRIIT